MTSSNSSAEYDFVVVGGGTAGCALAARLSEKSNAKVALVEAGRDHGPEAEPPAVLDTYARAWYEPSLLWPGLRAIVRERNGTSSAPSPYLQAHVLGGGSAVMGMHALRGLPADYDEWRDAGAQGWGWEDVRPAFRALERDLERSGPGYGSDGPIPMWRHDPVKWPRFAAAVSDAFARRGFARGDDINATPDDGLYPMPYNTLPTSRVTTARAYLTRDVRARPNFTLIPEAFARRLAFDGRRAVGLEIDTARGPLRLSAREFVLSAGAIQSPALLLRSGVGPADHLRTRGVPVVAGLAGVGEHLLNHPILALGARLKRGFRHPPSVRPHVNSLVRYSSRHEGCTPGDMYVAIMGKTAWHQIGKSIGALAVSVYKSYSEGRVSLSPTPGFDPQIEFRLLSDERDLERMTDGLALACEVMRDPAIAGIASETFLPGTAWVRRLSTPSARNALLSTLLSHAMDVSPAVERLLLGIAGARIPDSASRAELRSMAFETATPMYHVAGTCRMGAFDDAGSVVTPDCRVKTIEGVRVADASIMPTIPSANTFLTTVMVGEKAAQIIGQTSLRQ